jgi:hypothetical protein
MRNTTYFYRSKVNKISSSLFLIFLCFPYMFTFSKNIDVAPFAFIIGTMFYVVDLSKNNFRIPNYMVGFHLCAVIAFFMALLSPTFLSLRLLVGYMSIPMALYLGHVFSKKYSTKTKKYFKFAIIVYLIYAFLQQLGFNPLEATIGRTTYGGSRGLSSLTPEPGYLASTLICLTLIYSMEKKLGEIFIFLLVTTALVAKSATFVIPVLIAAVCVALRRSTVLASNLKTSKSGLFSAVTVTLILIIMYYLAINFGGRLIGLSIKLIENPLVLVKNDLSVQERLAHLIVPLNLGIRNYLVPFGFGNFYAEWQNYESYIFINIEKKAKIMSILGQGIFELGWVFFIAMFQVFRKIFGFADGRLFTAVLLLMLFTNALSMSLMLPWFLIGFLTYQYSNIQPADLAPHKL